MGRKFSQLGGFPLKIASFV